GLAAAAAGLLPAFSASVGPWLLAVASLRWSAASSFSRCCTGVSSATRLTAVLRTTGLAATFLTAVRAGVFLAAAFTAGALAVVLDFAAGFFAVAVLRVAIRVSSLLRPGHLKKNALYRFIGQNHLPGVIFQKFFLAT